MKTIYLIRHAKSDWSNAFLDDFDRDLNKRGKKSITIMAKVLKEKKIKPDIIISSPAKRTKSTIERLLKKLEFKEKITYLNKLYLADSEAILSIIKNIDNKYDSVFIIGHNPGLTDFVNLMTNVNINNIPTLGIIEMKCESEEWRDCKYHKAKVEFFIYPKMFEV